MKTKAVPVDNDLGEMLTWAVRYCLGRRTYAVSDTCRYVSALTGDLDDRTLCCMLRDVREYEPIGYGDHCDETEWLRLADNIETELKKRGVKPWLAIKTEG